MLLVKLGAQRTLEGSTLWIVEFKVIIQRFLAMRISATPGNWTHYTRRMSEHVAFKSSEIFSSVLAAFYQTRNLHICLVVDDHVAC